MEEIIRFLENHGIGYARDFSLSRVSAIALGGRCSVFAAPATETELLKLVAFLSDGGYKYKVVGKMTNILPPDAPYSGVIVSTAKLKAYFVEEGILFAECGAMLSKAAPLLAREGWGGIAELSGIPGTVGGMIYSNAGAFGLEISDILIDARCYSYEKRAVVTLAPSEMNLSYRHSVLSEGGLILLSARLSIKREDPQRAELNISEFSRIRRERQPTNFPSLGSTFLRPNGLYAAKLIDDAGLRGFSIGGASVSKKHAGFIVNTGAATADDVLRLIEYIQDTVFLKFGVLLVPEIEFLK